MTASGPAAKPVDAAREKALGDYRKKLLEHKELEARLKESKYHNFGLFNWTDLL